MTRKVVSPSLAPQFQLDQADIVLHNLVFNIANLLLDNLLVTEYVIQLGWDGVAQIKNACSSAADS